MPNYRRAIVPGGTFFFTVVSWRRRPLLCNPDIRAALRDAITTVREMHPMTINAWVLMPDHLHCVWSLPQGDADFAVRWAMIKRFVTRACAKRYPAEGEVSASRKGRNEGFIWQRRYWEHRVRDPVDLGRCVDYLHWNPVKHGHVGAVIDWPYSSFHRYLKQGHYQAGWGGTGAAEEDQGKFGE